MQLLKRISKYGFYLKLIISVSFLYILFSKFVQLNEIILNLGNIRYSVFMVCLVFSLLSLMFRSVRWKHVLYMMGYSIPLQEVFKLYAIGLYYGSITPGRAGEFIRGYYLSKKINISKKEGFISVLYERLFDISTPISFVFLYLLMPNVSLWFLLIFTFCLSSILWFLMLCSFFRLRKIIPYLNKWKYIKLDISFTSILIPVLMSILTWLCFGFVAYCVLLSMNLTISFTYLLFSVFVATLLVIVPLTINGWGLREGAYILLLSQYIDSTKIIIFSILFVLLTTYFLGLLGLLIENVASIKRRLIK